MKQSQKGEKSEFAAFLVSTEVVPPQGLSAKILSGVQVALNPNAWAVFAKLALLHFFSAVVTLSVCPQFGLRTFGEGMGLMHTFMGLGEYGCRVACGGLFTGVTLALCGLLLRPEEVRVLRSHELLQVGTVTFLSLGAFIMLDAEIALGFAMSWLLGAILSGAASLEISWALRRRFWAS